MTSLLVGQTTLPLPLIRRGKVRDVYAVGEEHVLLVASDRVSAFDIVMHELVPYKGAVLTQLTAWWLRQFAGEVANHMVTCDVDEIVVRAPGISLHRDELAGRAMLCVRTEVFPVECVVRGYLAGSAYKEYRETGTLAGERLPSGLQESSRFDAPIFSPATKAESGHDENITVAQMATVLGADVAVELEGRARLVYSRGRDLAATRGIIIADTKFEFGRDADGRILLIDEVMTPDSSRFWPADQWAEGSAPPSFDKQPLRDWLAAEKAAGRWDGDAPPPTLPDDVVAATSRRYLEAFERLTGAPLDLTRLP
ncbi:phosphoribosylaminoimidazolesuccinocarboxamide synthase [Pseudogemmatithrix spongiicola]|uniref:Phosphoribosylaminoimidazole-succinocarboxamide synthase n=1 Tax=Pseudogemmatithrix spongiicola TaxID=3062599 RepID=A0AA49K004_9BACT|nr:phosphoribosylaminoimidazolesuccinocarboxamide synthase [Gemmatimonadaceae bacterium 'strain 138']WKW15232.1 phosphoribosylaminoimidazolesuccinocarboxamide synthase [Gemmatimonadaceae bacterium 'strain 318']